MWPILESTGEFWGHDGPEFGTDLSPDDRRALIEFLKGFGAGRREPVLLE